MNCARKMSRSPARAKRPAEPSKAGNTVSSYGDKAGMERGPSNTVTKKPEWDGPGRVVTSEE